jgi:hypothetical protein
MGMNAMPTIETLRGWLDAKMLGDVTVALPLHGDVAVPRLLRRETRSPEAISRTSSCWAPNKPALDFEGEVTWAEFVIVRLLHQAGWDARWIKNWAGGREPCVAVGRREPLPKAAGAMLRRIDELAAIGTSGGPWDVLAWLGDEFLCIESKQHKSSDKLRETQIKWMDAALSEGITDFVIVEYDAPKLAGVSPSPSVRSQPTTSSTTPTKPKRSRSSTGRSGVLGPEYAAKAPSGQACEWLTKAGRPCQNPANYRVDGKWSCSRDHRQ